MKLVHQSVLPFALGALAACGGANVEVPPVVLARTTATAAAGSAEAKTTRPPANPWADVTRSPWPLTSELDSGRTEADLALACGTPDAALHRVAEQVASIRARGLGAPSPEEVTDLLRAAGEPHVRPKVFSASGRSPLDTALLQSRLAELRVAGTSGRCGVGLATTTHGGQLVVAIAVEALADLEALPVRARTGEWLTFDARLHVQAARPVLFVLGPRGAPRTVPTSMDSQGHVRAHFALDRAGAYTVQLVAELDLGPQPLLEARVFADTTPALRDPDAKVPGEDAGGGAQDADALSRMITQLRAQESLPPLARDDRLDRLARAHADRMRDRQRVGHDVGDGDPRSRFEAENSSVAVVGENVVHAATVEAAHRSLYASPSHRANLLRADYTHYGVAVAQAEDGSVYACEMFTR